MYRHKQHRDKNQKMILVNDGSKPVKLEWNGDIDDLVNVRINGIRVHKEIVAKKRIVVARAMYEMKHFKEVDQLFIKKGYSRKAAFEEVVRKYNFPSVEGFRRQYYARYANTPKTVKPSSLFVRSSSYLKSGNSGNLILKKLDTKDKNI